MTAFSIVLFLSSALFATTFCTGTLTKGSVCTHRSNDCAAGLACDGRGSMKRCIAYKQAGMECRLNEQFWICQPGLSCEDSTCKIPRNGVCTENRDDCVEGTSCDGRGSTKRCIVYKQPGMECRMNEPFWICQPGLSCEDSTCKIPRNGVCTNNRDDCVEGTSCDGRGSTKRCIVYKQPGMECRVNEPFWICQPGLSCENSACKVPVGSSCTAAPTQCVDGASCTNSKCTPEPRNVGETCDKTFACKTGLVCDGQCKIPKEQACDTHPTLCEAGSVCSGVRHRMLCSATRKEGSRCSMMGYLPCEAGLNCVQNVCVRGTSVPEEEW